MTDTKLREFWIADNVLLGRRLVEKDSPPYPNDRPYIHVREIIPTEPDYKKIAGELVLALEVVKKDLEHEHCRNFVPGYHDMRCVEVTKALAKAKEAGLE